jgi:hypothetical protein
VLAGSQRIAAATLIIVTAGMWRLIESYSQIRRAKAALLDGSWPWAESGVNAFAGLYSHEIP